MSSYPRVYKIFTVQIFQGRSKLCYHLNQIEHRKFGHSFPDVPTLRIIQHLIMKIETEFTIMWCQLTAKPNVKLVLQVVYIICLIVFAREIFPPQIVRL